MVVSDILSYHCHVELSLKLSLFIFKEQDTGFPLTERDRLGIRGLLPPRVISFEQQYARFSKFMLHLKFSSLVYHQNDLGQSLRKETYQWITKKIIVMKIL